MCRHRVCSVRKKRSIRATRWIWKGVQGVSLLCVVLTVTSCAQQSDLVKVETDLEGKIRKLDRDKKELNQILEQANKAIADSQAMLVKQKTELHELNNARAQIKDELRSLREETAAKVTDVSETQSHRVDQVNRKLAELTKQDAALKKLLEQRDADRSAQIAALRQDTDKARTQQAETVNAQFADFQGSLVEFKDALAKVDKRVNAKIETQAAQLSKLNTKLGTELATLQQLDTQHGKNQEEVTQTLAQLRDALGTTGIQLGTKLDAQGQDLVHTAEQVKQLQNQHAALAEKLVADVTQTQTRVETHAEDLSDLNQTVVGMREVLNSMLGLLGQRGDDQIKQLGETMARLDHLEQEQSSEAAKQAANIQAVSTHLNEITASVNSVVQAFEQFKTAYTARLNEHAAQLQEQAQRVAASAEAAAVQRLQQALEANVKQGNALAQSIARLKEVSNAMGTKLGTKVDEHEARLVELQTVVTQARQLNEQAVEQFKTVFAARLNEHAAQLQEQAQRVAVSAEAAAVQRLQQALEANVKQGNALAQSIARLKEASNAMGTKLGSKVDEHEARLVELQTAVTQARQLNEQAVEQFKTVFATRLNEHAAQLQEQARRVAASAEAAAVQRLERELQANVKQGNALAQSIARLKEASNAMGTKLGTKVDEHEARLIELQDALNQSRKPVKPKRRSR